MGFSHLISMLKRRGRAWHAFYHTEITTMLVFFDWEKKKQSLSTRQKSLGGCIIHNQIYVWINMWTNEFGSTELRQWCDTILIAITVKSKAMKLSERRNDQNDMVSFQIEILEFNAIESIFFIKYLISTDCSGVSFEWNV